jgi:hypothetical protein
MGTSKKKTSTITLENIDNSLAQIEIWLHWVREALGGLDAKTKIKLAPSGSAAKKATAKAVSNAMKTAVKNAQKGPAGRFACPPPEGPITIAPLRIGCPSPE